MYFAISEQIATFTLTDWFRITEVENVYCAVRAESLHEIDKFRQEKVSSELRSLEFVW